MKTHELASALTTLSRLLRSGPNVELSKLNLGAAGIEPDSLRSNAPAALAMLAGLASYSKQEWQSLIQELGLDVSVKATDSTRDLLGRLLKHINDNQDVRDRLSKQTTGPESKVSPELMKALSILLNK